jgi:hypothetical protein
VGRNPENLQLLFLLCRLWRLLLLDKSIGDELLQKTPDPKNYPEKNEIIGLICNNPKLNQVTHKNFMVDTIKLLREFQRENPPEGFWCVLKSNEIELLKKV